MYNKKVSEMTKEELDYQRKYFREWARDKKLKMTDEESRLAKEKKREYDKQVRDKNKDRIKKNKREYSIKNKDCLNQKSKIWTKKNKDRVKENQSRWYIENKDRLGEYYKEYQAKNRNKIAEYGRERLRLLKEEMFSVIGNKCCECGELNKSFLTLDHIKGGGRKECKEKGGLPGIIKHLKGLGWPKNYIEENYQILCYNHNCGRRREYLIAPLEGLTNQQKRAKKLWQEAFNFFGPCERCGITDLRFLTIDHINGNGTKERLGGGNFGVGLIKEFKKAGWPESLKEDYRLLCYNHNCARE
jgi:hypothetical protein